MATQDQLHEAYAAFRIPIGSSWETIKKRYKVLVRIWHPDRQGESLQGDAERELKEINHFYQDVFKPHFESGEHKENRYCICQSVPSSQAKKEPEPEQPKYEQSPPKSEPTPEPAPEPEPEFDSKFVWQPNYESEFQEASKTKFASSVKQKDAALAFGVVFVGLCVFSLFINSAKHSFASFTSSALAQTPITTNMEATPAPRLSYVPAISSVHAVSDDAKRAITYNETKIDAIKREIETLQAQIKWASKESSGQLFRELGVKEEELRQLQARTFELQY